LWGGGVRRQCFARGGDAQGKGAAPEAVDAQGEVEEGTEQRKKPDDAQPQGCGARIAFVEQGMNGSQQDGEKIEPGRDMRPGSQEMFDPVQGVLVPSHWAAFPIIFNGSAWK